MNNVLLSYVRRSSRSQKAVEKVIRKLLTSDSISIESKIKKFYAYQNYLKNNVNDFIIREAVKAVMTHSNPGSPSFTLEEQRFFNKVFRMVVKMYLEEEYLCSILSGKMDAVKRRDHLKVRHYLLKTLKG